MHGPAFWRWMPAYWPAFCLCVYLTGLKSGRPVYNPVEQFTNQSKGWNLAITYVFTGRLWGEHYWPCEAWIGLWDSLMEWEYLQCSVLGVNTRLMCMIMCTELCGVHNWKKLYKVYMVSLSFSPKGVGGGGGGKMRLYGLLACSKLPGVCHASSNEKFTHKLTPQHATHTAHVSTPSTLHLQCPIPWNNQGIGRPGNEAMLITFVAHLWRRSKYRQSAYM